MHNFLNLEADKKPRVSVRLPRAAGNPSPAAFYQVLPFPYQSSLQGVSSDEARPTSVAVGFLPLFLWMLAALDMIRLSTRCGGVVLWKRRGRTPLSTKGVVVVTSLACWSGPLGAHYRRHGSSSLLLFAAS
jgi:hypothetical protein